MNVRYRTDCRCLGIKIVTERTGFIPPEWRGIKDFYCIGLLFDCEKTVCKGFRNNPVRIEAASGDEVVIRNTGNIPIEEVELAVLKNADLITCTWTGVPVYPYGIATATCTGLGCTEGSDVKITVSTPHGRDTWTC